MTLLRLTPEYDYAVIELGANHQGEIAWTVSLTRPEAALVNNLAAAHLEGFGSLAGDAKAKGEIFSGLPENGIAIMNADNNDWLNWQSVIGSRKVWRFSPNAANSDFTATNIHVTSHGTEFTLQTPTGSVERNWLTQSVAFLTQCRQQRFHRHQYPCDLARYGIYPTNPNR